MSSELWSSISDAWLGVMWKVLWQGALSIGLVWLVCRLWTRIPPFFKSWLWRLVCLKLLVTFIWIIPFQVTVPLHVTPAPVTRVFSAKSAPAPYIDGGRQMIRINPLVGGTARKNRVDRIPITKAIAEPLMLVWITGVLLWSLRLVREWAIIRRLSAKCALLQDNNLNAEVSELCKRFGIRKVPTLMVHDKYGPMLTGLREPIIILPKCILSQNGLTDLRPVIAHELAHLKRNDLFWGLIASIAQGLCFFHPLVRLSQREFTLAQEMASDAASMEILALRPEEYGQSLLSTIKDCSSSRPNVATAGISESFQALERRLKVMSKGIKLSKRMKIGLVVVIVGLAVVGLVPWKAKAQSHKSIHIVYTFVRSQPALPKAWIDSHIAGLHKDLVRQWGPKWTTGKQLTENAFKAGWLKRYTPMADFRGQADYWGTPTQMIWVHDETSHIPLISYNGEFVVKTSANVFGLRPKRKYDHRTLDISDLDRGYLEEEVPYLGFMEPGMRFYRSKRHMTKSSMGWDERITDKHPELVVHYNRLRQPVSMELCAGSFVYKKYEYSNYIKFQGCYYPKTVIYTKYIPTADRKSFIDETTTYKVVSIDNESLSDDTMEMERPAIGVHIADLRAKYARSSGYSLNYTYRNKRRTMTETSEMWARKNR